MVYLELSRNYTSSSVQDACSTKERCAIRGIDGLQINISARYMQDLQVVLVVCCLVDGFTVKSLEETFFFLVIMWFA